MMVKRKRPNQPIRQQHLSLRELDHSLSGVATTFRLFLAVMQIVISAIYVSVTGWLQAPPQTHAFSHLSYSTRDNNYDILDNNYRIKTEIVKVRF
jgi:hypothetical protein